MEPTAEVRVSGTIIDLGPALLRLNDLDDRTLEVTSDGSACAPWITTQPIHHHPARLRRAR